MFKKIKENEGFQKFKELWQNKKTHDIIVLGLWLIFIFIVILFARSMTPSNTYITEEKSPNDLSNIRNYEFTYKTNDKQFVGQYYDDSIIFYKDNQRYYYKNDLYLVDDNIILISNYDLDILKINTKMLNNLISNITPTNTNNIKQYIIPLDKFLNIYEIDTDIDLSESTLYNVPLSIYYDNNEINKITLDLSNYYTLKTKNKITNILTIYLYNINNVSNFTEYYDKLLEGKQ